MIGSIRELSLNKLTVNGAAIPNAPRMRTTAMEAPLFFLSFFMKFLLLEDALFSC